MTGIDGGHFTDEAPATQRNKATHLFDDGL